MQLILNIIITFSIFLLISLSINLIYITTKTIVLSHASIISLGPYLYYFFNVQLTLSIIISLFLAIILSFLIGVILEILIYNPIRKRSNNTYKVLIASLGVYILLLNFISIVWDNDIKRITSNNTIVGNEIFGGYITNIQLTIIAVSISLFGFILVLLRYSRIGKKIRAISTNSELAEINGINSNKLIIFSVGICSIIAAISGILIAYDTGIRPTMGFNILLYGFVVMIIAGIGSTSGLISAAFLLALLQQLIAFYIDIKWMDTITYLVLILFLIWKPLGFTGNRLKKTEI